jgi:glycosyltransferase involved in cell wall biosynthesis
MYRNKKIAVSIPAYNEEKLIEATIKSVPDYVDFIVPVNDASKDRTWEIVKAIQSPRVHPVNALENGGVGASILAAHKQAIELGADIMVVMAGDNQMDPTEMPKLLDQMIDHDYDYVKGNRFIHARELKKMPLYRLLGNIFMSIMIKLASGYWSVSDPLNGYTALKADTFKSLNLDNIQKRYDFELSMLNELSFNDAKVKDVFIPAVYKNEKSTINSGLNKGTEIRALKAIVKGFLRRIFIKNTLLNLSPVAIFYIVGTVLFVFGLISSVALAIYSIGERSPSAATAVLVVPSLIVGIQLLLQAVLVDIQNEP